MNTEKLNQIAEDFIRENTDIFNMQLYWHYNEYIRTATIAKYNSIEELENSIMDDNYDYIVDAERRTIEDIITENFSEYSEEEMEYLDEYFSDNIHTGIGSVNYSDLYINLMPMQEENSNTEGGALYENISDIMKGEADEEIPMPMEIIKSLFDSQGYQSEDLKDIEKVNKSKFLKSFIREFENMPNDYCFLTILLKTDIEFYYNLKQGKINSVTIRPDKNLNMGFFLPWTGSGSMLEIELEKEWTIKTKEYLWQVEDSTDNFGGYSVDETYGLCRSAWTENFSYTTID